MFVVHIPAPIFRYAKRPNFKARAVGYNYLTKTLKREGMIVWAVLKKVQVRTMMNDEETGQSDGYHQAPIRTSVVFYMC